MSDPVIRLKQELLAAAERRYGHAPVRPPKRLLLVPAALAIAVTAALLFTAPWDDSPGFLARAQAALAADAATVLHAKWEGTSTSTDPACTVERGPDEIWIDQTPPHKYRVLVSDYPDPFPGDARALACSRGTVPAELGGTLDGVSTLRFVPPNRLTDARVLYITTPDPVADLREAISAGRAHDEGKTQLDGRMVQRIRLDPPSDCSDLGCPPEPTYVYVDPDTFYPVEMRGPGAVVLDTVVRLHMVTRFLTFEFLPRTAANAALADIEAQHPNASRG